MKGVLGEVKRQSSGGRERRPAAVGVAVLVAVLVGGGLWLASGSEPTLVVDEVPTPGSPVAVELSDGTPVWLAATDDGEVVALEALTPPTDLGVGLREVVSWCERAGVFMDSWYGSAWADDGAWIRGPAPDLPRYEVARTDGRLSIREARRTSPDRSGGAGRTPSRMCAVVPDPEVDEHDENVVGMPPLSLPHPIGDEVPVALGSAPRGHDRLVVRGTLIGDPGSTLAFCDGAYLLPEDPACPTETIPTAHEDRLDSLVLHAGRFVVQQRDGVLTDIWMLPGVKSHWTEAP